MSVVKTIQVIQTPEYDTKQEFLQCKLLEKPPHTLVTIAVIHVQCRVNAKCKYHDANRFTTVMTSLASNYGCIWNSILPILLRSGNIQATTSLISYFNFSIQSSCVPWGST